MQTEYPIHPAANLLPMMSDAEYASLKADIQASNGIRNPILLLNGQIIEGRNRYRACTELGLPIRTDPAPNWATNDPEGFVYSTANHRNLTDTQKACAALEFEEQLASLSESRYSVLRKICASGELVRNRTGLFGVTRRYIQLAAKIKRESPELYSQARSGAIWLTKARAILKRKTQISNDKLAQSLATMESLARSLRNAFVVICGAAAPAAIERFNEIIRDVRAVAAIDQQTPAEVPGNADLPVGSDSDPLSDSAPPRDTDLN